MHPAEEIRYSILALQREGNRQLAEALKAINLTPSQAEVLQVVAEFQPLTLTDLGARLVCETGTPSRLVNSMVKNGYLIRKENPNDGRAMLLELSEQAEAMLPHLTQIEDSYNASVYDMLQTVEMPLESILQVLRNMLAGSASGLAIELRKQGRDQDI